jgi:ABC-type molybdate transport system substrate-binding protein
MHCLGGNSASRVEVRGDCAPAAGVKTLNIVGPLPADINLEIVYGGAATTDSAAPDTVSAFVKFMAATENRPVWQAAGGVESPANSN